MTDVSDKTKPYFPLSGGVRDGFSNDEYASATCFCGAVQLKFAVNPPGLVDSFLCNCADCRKLTSSVTGAANFTVLSSPPHLTYTRGEDLLTQFAISSSTTTGNEMVNFFCSKCGSLMFRRGEGYPGLTLMRIGTVDDANLAEGKLKPRLEQFVENRVAWQGPAEGVRQVRGYAYGDEKDK